MSEVTSKKDYEHKVVAKMVDGQWQVNFVHGTGEFPVPTPKDMTRLQAAISVQFRQHLKNFRLDVHRQVAVCKKTVEKAAAERLTAESSMPTSV